MARLVRSCFIKNAHNLDSLGADSFQGRDKDVIVMSFVRSNDLNKVGMLLNDERRLNVGFSRAKSKLIMVGSKGLLGREEAKEMRKIMKILEERRWTCDVTK